MKRNYRYKYWSLASQELPKENEIKLKVFRKDKYALYFVIVIGIDFHAEIYRTSNFERRKSKHQSPNIATVLG